MMLAVHKDKACPCTLLPLWSPRCQHMRVCSVCNQNIGDEAIVCTKESMCLHARCFVCSKCKCPLKPRSYRVDLNGKLCCLEHSTSEGFSEEDYKTLACGWLFKQGQLVKKFRRRFFVLPVDSCELRYYRTRDTSDEQPNGVIDLSTVSTIQPAYLFVPSDKNHPDFPNGSLPALQLVTPCRIWNLACETDSIREYWLEAIRTAQATYGSASPAASCGFGRGARGSRGVPPSPSPPPCSLSGGLSPLSPRFCLGSPRVPQNVVKTSVLGPRPISPPGPFNQETDDAETSSPEDDCSSVSHGGTRSRTGSGVGRGDGSAQASQSIFPTTASNAEGLTTTRRILVQPIVIPTNACFSTGGTPTTAGAPFVAPGSPNRKLPSTVSSANGIGSPLQQWQASTPSGIQSPGWGCSSTSSSHGSDCQMNDSRLRAVSLGAHFNPRNGAMIHHFVVSKEASADSRKGMPKPIIAHSRMTSQDSSLLCSSSSNNTQSSACGTPSKLVPDPPEVEYGVSSFVFLKSAK